MTTEWPPRVWHGVVHPETGEDISPVRCSHYELSYVEASRNEASATETSLREVTDVEPVESQRETVTVDEETEPSYRVTLDE